MRAALVRWLGPWTPDSARPRDIRREALAVATPGRDAWVYHPPPGRVRGAIFVIPGLHFLGPEDPRLDRFCRILATSGLVTCGAFLPTFSALRVGPSLGVEALAAYDAFYAWLVREGFRGARPGVFSISAGSLPAARVVASRETGPWVVFGGYRDFEVCVRYSVGAPPGPNEPPDPVPPDPLNRPAVHLNLLPYLPDIPADPLPLVHAMLRFVEQTWGRPEMKEGGYRRVASRLAQTLGAPARTAFERATGLRDPDGQVAMDALARAGDAFAYMDPGPSFPDVRAEVFLVHGRDDDVVPLNEVHRLAHALRPYTPTQTFLTGLYGHTGSAIPKVGEAVSELRAMLGIVESICAAGTGGTHQRSSKARK